MCYRWFEYYTVCTYFVDLSGRLYSSLLLAHVLVNEVVQLTSGLLTDEMTKLVYGHLA